MSILGNNTIGGTSNLQVWWWSNRFTSTEAGTITDMSCYFAGSGPLNYKFCIWVDNGGIPGGLVAQSSIDSQGTSPSWKNLSISYTFTSGESLHFGVIADDWTITYFDSDPSSPFTEFIEDYTLFPNPPDPPTTRQQNAYSASIYVNYTPIVTSSTSRPFAYNPSQQPITGASQYGNIAVGFGNLDYSTKPGGIQWWNGPNEDIGYIIAKPIPSGLQPNSINRIYSNGLTASIGFNRSSEKTEDSFLNLVKSVFNQTFATATLAKNWLIANGYWTSYP